MAKLFSIDQSNISIKPAVYTLRTKSEAHLSREWVSVEYNTRYQAIKGHWQFARNIEGIECSTANSAVLAAFEVCFSWLCIRYCSFKSWVLVENLHFYISANSEVFSSGLRIQYYWRVYLYVAWYIEINQCHKCSILHKMTIRYCSVKSWVLVENLHSYISSISQLNSTSFEVTAIDIEHR